MTYYHYTIASRLVQILIDGFIKIMPESSKMDENEICPAWVTSNPKWDKTAFMGYSSEVLDNQGRIRITLKDKKYDHPSLYKKNIWMYDEHLVPSAFYVGVDSKDWGISLEPIMLSEFKKIELWKDEKWVEIPIERISYE